MRRAMPAICTGLWVMLAVTGSANATGMSLNHVQLKSGTTVDECKENGRNALRRAGLTLLSDTSEAAWGEVRPDIVAAVYCLVDHGLSVLSVAGPSSDRTAPVLDEILRYLRK